MWISAFAGMGSLAAWQKSVRIRVILWLELFVHQSQFSLTAQEIMLGATCGSTPTTHANFNISINAELLPAGVTKTFYTDEVEANAKKEGVWIHSDPCCD